MRGALVFSAILVSAPAGGLAELAAQQPERPGSARAEIIDLDGRTVGAATFEETPAGVLIRAEFTDLPPGTRAFHIHEVGRCEPPFETAGGHYNPFGREHGFRNPRGPHAGDLPNIHVPDGGRLTIEVLAGEVTIGPGEASLLAGDGTALVIHRDVDDYRSDPTGDAGPRIACGVIRR